MMWLLMWLNVSIATLNATLQLLVLYRFEIVTLYKEILRERVREMQ